MKFQFVKQEDQKGCAAACLAMIVGKTYEAVTKDFRNNFKDDGMNTEDMITYLTDHGFSVIKKSVEGYHQKDFARAELFQPFAPIHIVTIQWNVDDTLTHVVVMDNKGKLFCPYENSDAEVRDAYKVTEVFGIYKTYPVARG